MTGKTYTETESHTLFFNTSANVLTKDIPSVEISDDVKTTSFVDK